MYFDPDEKTNAPDHQRPCRARPRCREVCLLDLRKGIETLQPGALGLAKRDIVQVGVVGESVHDARTPRLKSSEATDKVYIAWRLAKVPIVEV